MHTTILETLKERREVVSICEWLLTDLGGKIALDIKNTSLDIVLVKGKKLSSIKFPYIKTQLKEVLTRGLVPFLEQYYNKYKKDYASKMLYDPIRIAQRIFNEMIDNSDKYRTNSFDEVLAKLLVDIAKIKKADSTGVSKKLFEKFKDRL